MKLALSVRVAESFRDKHQAVMPLDALADLAAAEGYQGICMRASQLGVQTPLAEVGRKTSPACPSSNCRIANQA